jgi:hypothetical protein
MTASKFIEILDLSDLPYSQKNVSLEDSLQDTRHRSGSQSSMASPTEQSSPSSQVTQPYAQPSKNRLRGFSLKKKT